MAVVKKGAAGKAPTKSVAQAVPVAKAPAAAPKNDGFFSGWQETKRPAKGGKEFWILAEQSKKVTVLDTMPALRAFFHKVKVDSNNKDIRHIRCTADGNGSPCSLCDVKFRRLELALVSVIDHSEYEFEGRPYKNIKKVVLAGRRTRELFASKQTRLEERDPRGMTGMTFNVSRSTQQAARCGDDWEPDTRLNPAQVKALKDGEGKPVDTAPYGLTDTERRIYYSDLFPLPSSEDTTALLDQHTVEDAGVYGPNKESAVTSDGSAETVAY